MKIRCLGTLEDAESNLFIKHFGLTVLTTIQYGVTETDRGAFWDDSQQTRRCRPNGRPTGAIGIWTVFSDQRQAVFIITTQQSGNVREGFPGPVWIHGVAVLMAVGLAKGRYLGETGAGPVTGSEAALRREGQESRLVHQCGQLHVPQVS